MTELNLELDKKANDTIIDLMHHYQLKSKTELISKALTFLKIAAYIDRTHGELVARKEGEETRIIIR
ncbi:MAG TPA: hypothetical protein VK559_04750 [Ferruginibacter sp.]|nr:hypothetical protein [Ferruginibacter sp.]